MRFLYAGIILTIAALSSLYLSWFNAGLVLWTAVFFAIAAYIDIAHLKIPNSLNAALAASLLLVLGPMAWGLDMWGESFGTGSPDSGTSFPRAVLAGALTLLGFLTLHLFSPSGLGMGDVKLAFSLGMLLGWFSTDAIIWGLGLGFLLNAAAAAIAVFGKVKVLPFAPALTTGSLLGVLAVAT